MCVYARSFGTMIDGNSKKARFVFAKLSKLLSLFINFNLISTYIFCLFCNCSFHGLRHWSRNGSMSRLKLKTFMLIVKILFMKVLFSWSYAFYVLILLWGACLVRSCFLAGNFCRKTFELYWVVLAFGISERSIVLFSSSL